MRLRDYQQSLKDGIYAAWGSHRNVLGVLPTGGGKTVVVSDILHDHRGAAAVVAHRKELVSQMSIALGRQGVIHGVLAPEATLRDICQQHVRELGTVMVDATSPVKVAGIDTLISPRQSLSSWANSVSLWVTDEAHHLLRANKWGKGAEMFPNARGLGVTATPTRADGKGLGSHADGVFHTLVEGPSMRDLINRGFLCEYRIFAPPSDFDISSVPLSKDGDFTKPGLKVAAAESHIVGDVVSHYLRIAPGKLGLTFASDVETAKEIAAQYNAMGVRAEMVDANTPARVRAEIMQRFRNRELTQLVNVDLFGEGVDIPAVEVVSFARPTMSYSLYVQQFGRSLRILEGKDRAIIIDHVGNVVRHGLPDKERFWSLDANQKSPRMKKPDDEIPLRYCLNEACLQPYEKFYVCCPYCGTKWEPLSRSKPEFVDGDLFELDPATLASLRGEVAAVDADPLIVQDKLRYAGASPAAIAGAGNQQMKRRQEQEELRLQMGYWSAMYHNQGLSDAEIQRRFYLTFGIDMLSAQALGRPDAVKLQSAVLGRL